MRRKPHPPGPSMHDLPSPKEYIPPDPVGDTMAAAPKIVCMLGRPWLKGWKQIGQYCGFGKGKGTTAARTGRSWELNYGLPVHRLPDKIPRALPYELDQWLITFTELWKHERGDPKVPPAFKKHWANSGADSEG